MLALSAHSLAIMLPGGFEIVILLPMLALGLGAFILWIWALVDCISNEPSEGNDKIIWILVIVLANWIGALIYLIVRRPQRRAALGR
jgi:hypothetical protein